MVGVGLFYMWYSICSTYFYSYQDVASKDADNNGRILRRSFIIVHFKAQNKVNEKMKIRIQS